MKISTHSTPAARHDGGQPDDTNGETSPAVVYDTCAACPVYAYRDAVCNGNLRALVRSGNPSDAELAEARDALAAEFADLSGNLNLQAANAATARSMALRYRLLALSAALLAADHPNAAALFARSGWGKLPLEQQIKRAEARIKELTVRLNKETRQAEKRKPTATKPFTEADFNMQTVIVSKWVGFHLSDRMMLAELAGYFKAYTEQTKLETNHVRPHKRH